MIHPVYVSPMQCLETWTASVYDSVLPWEIVSSSGSRVLQEPSACQMNLAMFLSMDSQTNHPPFREINPHISVPTPLQAKEIEMFT
jgi:hypothetical protein